MAVPSIWHLLLLTLAFCSTVAVAQDNLDQPPPTKWYIGTPEFTADRLDLFLKYPISDVIPYDNLSWKLLDGTECSSGGANDITTNDYLGVELTIEDDTIPDGDGTAWRFITLAFTFDPTTIRSSPIFSDQGLDQYLEFCVRLSANSAPAVVPGALELYFKETSVSVLIQQDGQVDADQVVVTPAAPGSAGATQAYKLRGFLCNETNHEIVDPPPIYQGMLTKVCVTPTADALADGIYMHAIDSFTWIRETIFQPAILPHQEVQVLTKINCVPGMRVCSFVTLLKADFFYRLGRVYGAGVGWLQFGQGDYNGDERRLIKGTVEFDLPSTSSNSADSQQAQRRVQSTINGTRPDGADYSTYAGAGPFAVDLPVTRLYRAYGWLCDKDNLELDPMQHPVVKGDKARVCVTPDDIAINQDNVRVRNIDSFTWNREQINVTQVAITSNAKAEPKTEIFCTPGSLVCAFETELDDAFFSTPGAVTGNGVVWLQFGEDSRRSLAVDLQLVGNSPSQNRQRNLQYSLEDFDFGASYLPIAAPGFAGASPFDVVIYVLPPVAERELYSCRAYECDYSNKEFVSNEAKKEGDSIRMCVRPSKAAEDVGVKMWKIEWWTWKQVDRIQEAIVKQGQEAPDGRTVQFCYRGMDVCFFQTRLIPLFFSAPQPNALNGDGVCWITFGEGFAFPAPITIEENPEKGGAEIDPTADPLYAGQSDIAIIFPTDGNWTEPKVVCPPEDHTLKGWWEDEDDTMKAIYITAMTLAGSGLCCLWGLCFFCNRRDRKDEEVIIDETTGNVIINVDVQDTMNTQKIIENKEEYHLEETLKETTTDERSHGSIRSSRSESRRKRFKGKVKDFDVAFGDEKHPGTIALRKKVRIYIKKNPEETYGPEAFRSIRKKFEDGFFLVRDRETGDWREAKKRETAAQVGEIWAEEKKKVKEKGGEYTRDDLKELERKESRRGKSKKVDKEESSTEKDVERKAERKRDRKHKSSSSADRS